jgi:hypothetical protein
MCALFLRPRLWHQRHAPSKVCSVGENSCSASQSEEFVDFKVLTQLIGSVAENSANLLRIEYRSCPAKWHLRAQLVCRHVGEVIGSANRFLKLTQYLAPKHEREKRSR